MEPQLLFKLSGGVTRRGGRGEERAQRIPTQQYLLGLEGLLSRCVLRAMGNAFMSQLILTGDQRSRQWVFLLRSDSVSLLWEQKLYTGLRESGLSSWQRALLLSTPTFPTGLHAL